MKSHLLFNYLVVEILQGDDTAEDIAVKKQKIFI